MNDLCPACNEIPVEVKGCCRKCYMSNHYTKNKDKLCEKQKARYERNKANINDFDKANISEYQKAYYVCNKVKIREKSKAYYEHNKDIIVIGIWHIMSPTRMKFVSTKRHIENAINVQYGGEG